MNKNTAELAIFVRQDGNIVEAIINNDHGGSGQFRSWWEEGTFECYFVFLSYL